MTVRPRLICWLLFIQLLGADSAPLDHRGIWVRGISIASPESIPKILDLAQQLKITDLYIQVVVGGYAYYKSEILPRSEYLAKNSSSDYDPLDSILKLAKKQNLKIHAWVNTLLIWSMDNLPDSSRHINYTHPDWFLKDLYGRSMLDYLPVERQDLGIEGTFLDPKIEGVREYLKEICSELLAKYDVDGIHLDFMRYPGIFWGIDDTMLCALLCGLNTKDMRWLTLTRYPRLNLFDRWVIYNFYLANIGRQKSIKKLVEDIYSTVKKFDDGRFLSCAVVASPGRALYQYAQKWWEWDGVIDYPVVMSYTPDTYLFRDFLDFSLYHMPASIMGIGFLWKNMDVQANTEIDFVRKKKGTGICFFDFASLDTMADLKILKSTSLTLSDTLARVNSTVNVLDSVFFELPKLEWVDAGMSFIRYGEDLDFAKFLLSLSLNPEQDIKKMGLKREELLKYLQSDVACFEYLNRKILRVEDILLEPPFREIEYTFLKWNNSDSTAVREKAKKVVKFDFRKTIYPDAMNPLAWFVFKAGIGEKRIVELRSGIYIFRVKKIKEGGKWIKKNKVKRDLLPLYIYWTIKRKFDDLYYGKL
ncbi:MAG: glycoside hydrolase family 10 protein [bacterium]